MWLIHPESFLCCFFPLWISAKSPSWTSSLWYFVLLIPMLVSSWWQSFVTQTFLVHRSLSSTYAFITRETWFPWTFSQCSSLWEVAPASWDSSEDGILIWPELKTGVSCLQLCCHSYVCPETYYSKTSNTHESHPNLSKLVWANHTKLSKLTQT